MGKYRVFVHQNVENLGDVIQTIALTRLLPDTIGVLRDQPTKNQPLDLLMVANGFICDPCVRDSVGENCLFAGVHAWRANSNYSSGEIGYRYLDWASKTKKLFGARDPVTQMYFSGLGAPSEMVGCATLTLPRYDGPRSGVLSVDFEGPGMRLSHRIDPTMSVLDQWEQGLQFLDLYRKAESVYTTRLHVALPCLAFGTPVCFINVNPWEPDRISILQWLGVRFGEMAQLETSAMKRRYINFLECYLNEKIVEGDPIIPDLSLIEKVS